MKRDIIAILNVQGGTGMKNDTDYGNRNDIIYDKPIDDTVCGRGSDELIGNEYDGI